MGTTLGDCTASSSSLSCLLSSSIFFLTRMPSFLFFCKPALISCIFSIHFFACSYIVHAQRSVLRVGGCCRNLRRNISSTSLGFVWSAHMLFRLSWSDPPDIVV